MIVPMEKAKTIGPSHFDLGNFEVINAGGFV